MTSETPNPKPSDDTEAHAAKRRGSPEDVEAHGGRTTHDPTDDVDAHGRRSPGGAPASEAAKGSA